MRPELIAHLRLFGLLPHFESFPKNQCGDCNYIIKNSEHVRTHVRTIHNNWIIEGVKITIQLPSYWHEIYTFSNLIIFE